MSKFDAFGHAYSKFSKDLTAAMNAPGNKTAIRNIVVKTPKYLPDNFLLQNRDLQCFVTEIGTAITSGKICDKSGTLRKDIQSLSTTMSDLIQSYHGTNQGHNLYKKMGGLSTFLPAPIFFDPIDLQAEEKRTFFCMIQKLSAEKSSSKTKAMSDYDANEMAQIILHHYRKLRSNFTQAERDQISDVDDTFEQLAKAKNTRTLQPLLQQLSVKLKPLLNSPLNKRLAEKQVSENKKVIGRLFQQGNQPEFDEWRQFIAQERK